MRMHKNAAILPVKKSYCQGSLRRGRLMAGVHLSGGSGGRLFRLSTRGGDGLPWLWELVTNPAPYGPSCDYAYVPALLLRASSHLVSDKKSDA